MAIDNTVADRELAQSAMETSAEKIIYILGGGHSGSTLLDMILGSTDESFSVGELMYFDYYKGYKHENLHRLVDGRLCTCEKLIDECPIWSQINFEHTDNVPKHESAGDSIKILLNLINPFEKWAKFKIAYGRNREVYSRVFSEAQKSKPKLRFIVDSSKDPRRLYELVNDTNIGPENLAVIHLVRDGRGYIYSYQKGERLEVGRALRGTLVCMLEWIVVNLISVLLIKKHRLNAFSMSYDRFAEDPNSSLVKLGEFLNLDIGVDSVIERINSSVYHNLHGNPIRQRQITSIRRDVKWRTFFSPLKRVLLTVILYPFNRVWVYPKP